MKCSIFAREGVFLPRLDFFSAPPREPFGIDASLLSKDSREDTKLFKTRS